MSNNQTEMKEIILKRCAFLKNSDLELFQKEICIFDKSKRAYIHKQFMSGTLNVTTFQNNIEIAIELAFSIIDSLIDYKYPSLIDKNFKKKQEEIPRDNMINKIFYDIYSLLRAFRNAIVHTKITMDKTEFTLRDFSIKILNPKMFFDIIFKLTILISENTFLKNDYINELIYDYYCEFRRLISETNHNFSIRKESLRQEFFPIQYLFQHRIYIKENNKEIDVYPLKELVSYFDENDDPYKKESYTSFSETFFLENDSICIIRNIDMVENKAKTYQVNKNDFRYFCKIIGINNANYEKILSLLKVSL